MLLAINRILKCSLVLLLTLMPEMLAQAQMPDISKRHVKINTVVIDPGHGGKDPGATGCDKKTLEKDLVLILSKKLRDKIKAEYPEVKVILTRDNDVFIPLLERAEIANRNNADLFISMHINSNKKSTPNGFSAHILGESTNKNKDVFANNMDVCKTENSVITLEDDYSVKYAGFDPSDPSSAIIFELMQNAYYEQSLLFASYETRHMSETSLFYDRGISQDNFYVLWRTYMPSVLIECGFLSNAEDIRKLKTDSSRDKMVNALFEGFKEFKCNYEGISYNGKESTVATVKPSEPTTVEQEEQKPVPTPPAPVISESQPEKQEINIRSTNEEASPVKEENRQKHLFPGNRQQQEEANISYGIQVLVSAKEVNINDPYFKGYKPSSFFVGKYHKYIVCISSSLEEVKSQFNNNVNKIFPDSFIVKIEDGIITSHL